MSEYTDLFERAGARYEDSSISTEGFHRRRERTQRNHRVSAGVVGLAVFVAAIWFVTSEGWFQRTEAPVRPAERETGPPSTLPAIGAPTYELGPVTPEDLALGESFMDAWIDGDGEAALALFWPDGNFDGFQPEILPALHDWFRATGWTFARGGCGVHGWDDRHGVVGCGFTFENDLTRGVGLGPEETGISLVTDAGRIETAWYGAGGDVGPHLFGSPNFRPVWYAFVDWISSQHPQDFPSMYDSGSGYPFLEPASIELWQRYTTEFIASPEAQALARSIQEAGWDGEGFPPKGEAPSLPVDGELVADHAELHVGYVFVYADGRVISNAFGSVPLGERRLTAEGVELVRSGAVEPSMFLPPYNWADLPEGAWADPVGGPFVPSRYAVCFYQETGDANPGTVNGGYEYPSRIVPFLPAEARSILQGKDHAFERSGGALAPGGAECSEITTDEARDLEAIVSGVELEDAEGDAIAVEINPLLPHGEWVTMGG